MENTIRSVKRWVGSTNQSTNTPFGEKLVHLEIYKNPYRANTKRHAQFERIMDCLVSAPGHQMPVHQFRSIVRLPSGELWKESRLGHLKVEFRRHNEYSEWSSPISVISYLDNIRLQWKEVVCKNQMTGQNMIRWREDGTGEYSGVGLTLRQICLDIERWAQKMLSNKEASSKMDHLAQCCLRPEDASTWGFMVFDSRETLLNTRDNMHSLWFDEKRFQANTHDFSSVVHLEVVPLDSSIDEDTLRALGLLHSRVNCRQPPPISDATSACHDTEPEIRNAQPMSCPTSPNGPTTLSDTSVWRDLRQEQDLAFKASLEADRKKAQHNVSTSSSVSNTSNPEQSMSQVEEPIDIQKDKQESSVMTF